MSLVAGVDSSTQSCKIVIRDAVTGELVRQGQAPHPEGTEVDPEAWWQAFLSAAEAAGGLADVAAIAVAGQQHGMVCLDADGAVVRPALLWNDTRSAEAAATLKAELGAEAWAERTGLVPVASFTVSKLRWLAEHEPELAARVAAVCLPHDHLTWRLRGGGLEALVTDRSDVSGTGYWSPATGEYDLDLVRRALGTSEVRLPRVLGPAEAAGTVADGAPGGLRAGTVVGPGCGDNAGAALGLGAETGDVVVSLGTSAVVSAVATEPSADPSGLVAGFADASGRHLPLVCTLNGAPVLESTARMLGVSLEEFSALALRAPAGAGGLVMVPYLAGERTPDLPHATGAVHGLTPETARPEYLARAAVEGLLCGLADGLDALSAQGVPQRRVILIGGGARSEAVRQIAPAVFGCPVSVPEPGEYVADGAARQAAWTLAGGAEPPAWRTSGLKTYRVDPEPSIRRRYAQVRDLTDR